MNESLDGLKMLQGYLDNLKIELTEEDCREILMIAIDDVKFNRVGFNKKTSDKEFVEILQIARNVYMRTKAMYRG